jgi:hypothetical protein
MLISQMLGTDYTIRIAELITFRGKCTSRLNAGDSPDQHRRIRHPLHGAGPPHTQELGRARCDLGLWDRTGWTG